MPTTEKEDQANISVVRKMIEPLRSHRFKSFPGHAWLKLFAGVPPNTIPDLRDFQAPITSLITLQPEFTAILQSIDEFEPLEMTEKSQDTIFLQNMGCDVVHSMLRKLINADASMEQALTSLRRAYLQFVFRQPAGVEPRHLRTMATIAAQCFNNEYVFYESAKKRSCAKDFFRTGSPEIPTRYCSLRRWSHTPCTTRCMRYLSAKNRCRFSRNSAKTCGS